MDSIGFNWIQLDSIRFNSIHRMKTVGKSMLPSAPFSFLSLPLADLCLLFSSRSIPSFRARQMWGWVYRKGVLDLGAMRDLPEGLRTDLAQWIHLDTGKMIEERVDKDGTRKWAVEYGTELRRAVVESVFIPSKKGRGTLCFSSQHGCSLKCSFCHTGTMDKKVMRNLKVEEIVGQVMLVKNQMGDFERIREGQKLGLNASSHAIQQQVTNFVGMGMGEPGYNFKNVKAAMAIVMDPSGLAVSKRRITISTSGILPILPEIASLGVNLAISLHSVRNSVRDVLVPINKTYSLEALFEACRDYVLLSGGKIGFEYTLLKGVNDSLEDASELCTWIKKLEAASMSQGIKIRHYVNVIPFNPWPGTIYETPLDAAVIIFSNKLTNEFVDHAVRWPRGRDIGGACGQLATSLRPTLVPLQQSSCITVD